MLNAGAGEIVQVGAHHMRRVLVVDDNEDAAELVASMLSILGFDTMAVYGGAEALAAAASYMPSVIFLDLGMPGMSGFEVATKLRDLPGLETVFIAALTGWGDAATRARTAAVGFDTHLQKPAAMDDLVRICEKAPT